eukprot:Lithocolla_globosa_v1_NODE_1085_length_2885_cov_18.564311.p1 type:complete len:896 gc:universal NODE_1085_length_2885_cov_18.564311:83-2770(+)
MLLGRAKALPLRCGQARFSSSIEILALSNLPAIKGQTDLKKKPKELPVLVCENRPIFPGQSTFFNITDPYVYRPLLKMGEKGSVNLGHIGLFLRKQNDQKKSRKYVLESLDEIYRVGTYASVRGAHFTGTGLRVLVQGSHRVQATALAPNSQEIIKHVLYHDMENMPFQQNRLAQSFVTGIHRLVTQLAKTSAAFQDALHQPPAYLQFELNPDDPADLCDIIAALLKVVPVTELQEVLESHVIEERLRKIYNLLKKEKENLELTENIAKDVNEKITTRQRQFFLNEQLKVIKKELGMEKDDKGALIQKYKDKKDKLVMPPAVEKVFDDELKRLSFLEADSSEFNVIRTYLDWLTDVPWGINGKENFDIFHAEKVLESDHYGLEDVKKRILEFIAVGKLKGTVQGKIICLVGPPGVGKTSIGRSIGHTLQRPFHRFSVGGLTDVAEIKGHRRTYVGAMPGKIIQILKLAKKQNPVVLIDEVDKIARGGYQGDPSSALLEMLDPEQNANFLDHYLDCAVDLSRVLFVCTANVTDTIPPPLLDRMEVIRLSGYIAEEKVQIANKYLIPTAEKDTGISKSDYTIGQGVVDQLIRFYTPEAGVRNLQRFVEKIMRKVAFKVVKRMPRSPETTEGEENADSSTETLIKEDKKGVDSMIEIESNTPNTLLDSLVPPEVVNVESHEPIEVTLENLTDYVGHPVLQHERLYETLPTGVITGLAWTSMGGAVLYVEIVPLKNDKAELRTTGQMGSVMKESSEIAYTYAKGYLSEIQPDNTFFKSHTLHLHVPEGATSKDGPSAGVTMTTALLSLAMNKPSLPDLAMTGELTLTGKVLKIGGIKEKTIAAKRSKINKIIMPEANRSDWIDLDKEIKKGVTPYFVNTFPEVLDIVFESQKPTEENSS